jgi:hypothetical protein
MDGPVVGAASTVDPLLARFQATPHTSHLGRPSLSFHESFREAATGTPAHVAISLVPVSGWPSAVSIYGPPSRIGVYRH